MDAQRVAEEIWIYVNEVYTTDIDIEDIVEIIKQMTEER